jgi:hypothetical protein
MSDKAFVVKNGLVVNTNLIYASGGEVGINTNNPEANLHVVGSAIISANLTIGNVFANTTMITVNSSNVVTFDTTLKVYYSNNDLAFPV